METFDWHSEAEKQWDNRADFWNQQSQQMWEGGSRSTIIPFFLKYVQPQSNVLDAGCGDGYGSYKLYKNGFDVVGMDLSHVMIEKAENRLSNERLTFVQGDLTNLPFENESFTNCMAINSLEWTENPLHVLNEIKRVTKPGGIFCVGLLGPTAGPRKNAYQRLYDKKVICNTMMPWEFEQLASENGWTVRDGMPVYKEAVKEEHVNRYPKELKQALSFMWVFILEKQ